MSDFIRYAIYHVPAPGPLAAFGADWLGWDVAAGSPRESIAPTGLTDVPRKYGFHATIKPPFRLAQGRTAADLQHAVADFCKAQAPVSLDGLGLSRIGRFLALTPTGDVSVLNALAARTVEALDAFRAPASAAELDRRRAGGLSPSQEENLTRWGYPYVMEDFRFHMTLTGRTDAADEAERLLRRNLDRLDLAPYVLDSLSLVGERDDGMFEQLHRYTLAG